jgi:hypothetical protein
VRHFGRKQVTDIYAQLDYRQYKHLEDQLRRWDQIETSHTSVDGFYHKALRLEIGDLTLEIQGPAVKQPVHETVSAYPVGLPPQAATDGGWLPNFLLRQGHDRIHHSPNPPDMPDDPIGWLGLGYLTYVGWKSDPDMDLNDASWELAKVLDPAISLRNCPSCHAALVNVQDLMKHMYLVHQTGLEELSAWLARWNVLVPLTREEAIDNPTP